MYFQKEILTTLNRCVIPPEALGCSPNSWSKRRGSSAMVATVSQGIRSIGANVFSNSIWKAFLERVQKTSRIHAGRMALVTHNGTVAISVPNRRAARHVPLVKGSASRSMRYVFMNGMKTVYYSALAGGRREGGSSININLAMGERLRVL